MTGGFSKSISPTPAIIELSSGDTRMPLFSSAFRLSPPNLLKTIGSPGLKGRWLTAEWVAEGSDPRILRSLS
ncbi:hypothetical protein A3C52_03585 [Candidatus Peribacteria bacterium RIFCSPHIGHO2_02_FULL_51_15]|nr:MAG: hypothetical protein A3C52_03585 [Candidatus Peribacteria bacterium RIFCSPHIGHO2_02_FULL_51_15]